MCEEYTYKNIAYLKKHMKNCKGKGYKEARRNIRKNV